MRIIYSINATKTLPSQREMVVPKSVYFHRKFSTSSIYPLFFFYNFCFYIFLVNIYFFSFNKTPHCSALCVCVQRGKSVVGCGALVSEHFSGVGRFKKSFFSSI